MQSRSKPLALLLIILTFVGTSNWSHADDADADQLTLVAHNHSAHREVLRLPAAPNVPSHCALCHWLQSLRAGSVRQARVPLAAVRQATRLTALEPDIRTVDVSHLPSRAPPA